MTKEESYICNRKHFVKNALSNRTVVKFDRRFNTNMKVMSSADKEGEISHFNLNCL